MVTSSRAALVTQLEAGDTLTLFSSSWKDRLAAGTYPRGDVVDARVPVHLLNLAWHRAAWPPVELIAPDRATSCTPCTPC